MIDTVLLPKLEHPQVLELARMLLARKLMPEDRRGTLSPMVNAPLGQCVLLHPDVPKVLVAWLKRLQDQFANELGDTDADPSLRRHLESMGDHEARMNLTRQYFLPFQPIYGSEIHPLDVIAHAFGTEVNIATRSPDMGPLYPVAPQDGSIVLPKPFARSIFDQILIGRHSHLHLEAHRLGKIDAAASDAVIHVLMDTLAAFDGSRPPFHSRELRQQDFAQSFAYTQMMELGFSRDEMMAALSPWELID